jgi:hypothetical protein
MATPEQALEILSRSMELFDVKWDINVVFDTPELEGNVIAYYKPLKREIGFRSNHIPDQTIYHEFFHMLAHYYGYDDNDEESCESWARIGEALWLGTHGDILNFKCWVCGDSRIRMLSNGTEWECLNCGSVYQMDFSTS